MCVGIAMNNAIKIARVEITGRGDSHPFLPARGVDFYVNDQRGATSAFPNPVYALHFFHDKQPLTLKEGLKAKVKESAEEATRANFSNTILHEEKRERERVRVILRTNFIDTLGGDYRDSTNRHARSFDKRGRGISIFLPLSILRARSSFPFVEPISTNSRDEIHKVHPVLSPPPGQRWNPLFQFSRGGMIQAPRAR